MREYNFKIYVWIEFWYFFYCFFDFKEDKFGYIYYKMGIYCYYVRKVGMLLLSIEIQSLLVYIIDLIEVEFLYLILFFLGILNINYYFFVGGENLEGYELYNGIIWDVYLLVGFDGFERFYFGVIKVFLEIMIFVEGFVDVEFRLKVVVGFYEFYEVLNFWGYEGFEESIDLNEYFFGERGFFMFLVMSNIFFDVVDFEDVIFDEFLSYDQFWVYSFDFMFREVQDKFVEFVVRGGNFVIFLMFLCYDENLEFYSFFKDFFGVEVEREKVRRNLCFIQFFSVLVEGIDRMFVRNMVCGVRGGEFIVFLGEKFVGVFVRKGGGSVVVFGFRFQYYMSYYDFYRKFVWKFKEFQGVREDFEVMNLDMIVFFMEGKGYVYFVVINLWGYFIKGRISYRGLEVLVFLMVLN